MNSPMEDRLRAALVEAGATVDTGALKPLRTPERRRSRVDLRLVSAAVAVVLAGATTAVWLGVRGDEHVVTLAAPTDGQAASELTIYLCSRSASGKVPSCKGQDVTLEQAKSIEAAAKEVPGVVSVTFLDREAVFAAFRQEFAHNQQVLDAVTADDLRASFRLRLEPGTNPMKAKQALARLPGIEDIDLVPTAVRPSETQITVLLCDDGSAQPTCGAERASDGEQVIKEGKRITARQKDRVVALLKASKQVKSFFFENQTSAYADFKRAFGGNKTLVAATRVEDMPESYRLSMRSELDDWSELVKTLRQQRGVASVAVRRCPIENLALSRYRVSLPKDKWCRESG
ncbi:MULTISPECIES: permease-like cell division protein FtsX [unclassified Nonomuraea]|uniref:permease-like cell division protein FtsX n=1 Tax=unclassified Nonomuraea TaxID=2593643 RepID=UPI0033CF7FE7